MAADMPKLLIGILALTLTAAAGFAQKPQGSWEDLKQHQAGHKIKIVDMSLKAWEGRLVSVSDEAITIRELRRQQEIAVERGNVLRVTDLERSRRGRNALIGFAAGILVGAVYATREGREDLAPWGYVVFVGGVFGGAGAGVGALVPSHPALYRAGRGVGDGGATLQSPQHPR
jgi:hypothetical protein